MTNTPKPQLVPTILPRGTLTPGQVVQLVAERFHRTPAAIRGRARRRDISSARHVAIWLCRQMTRESMIKLGWYFNYRDHTTVLHACAKVEKERQHFAEVAEFLDGLLAAARAIQPKVRERKPKLILPVGEVM